MASPYAHRALDFGRDLFARREFYCNGRTYGLGDLFPWRQAAVEERLVRLLWDQGQIDHDLPPSAVVVNAAPALEPAPAAPVLSLDATDPKPYRPTKRR